MSTTDDSSSTSMDCSSTRAHDGTNSGPSSPDCHPKSGQALTSKGPFPATVEDCPEEDGVPVGISKGPTPPRSSSPSIVHVTADERPQQADRQGFQPQRPTPSQGHSLPPFIQLNGPAHQSPSRPEAFRYLDPDSPVLTAESIQRSLHDGNHADRGPHPTSPSAHSNSSLPSSHHSDVFSQADRNGRSDHSWSPEQLSAANGSFPSHAGPHGQMGHANPAPPGPGWNGSPEMAFGNPQYTPFANHNARVMPSPYLAPGVQAGAPMSYQKPPLTGYQHLSQKLTGALFGFPNISPIYRRFEALNHRLLLQLQDELSVLEEELEKIDNADTQSRAGPTGFAPATCRTDIMAQGGLSWKKQDILGNIGWRLGQYSESSDHPSLSSLR